MTAVRPADTESVLRRLDPRIAVVLIYGPDSGLVAERAKRAAYGAVADPDDPFQLVRIEGDVVAAEPGRLADEVGTIGLFGGRRAIWIRPTGRSLVPALTAVLDADMSDSLIVVEAGELNRNSPLRTLCERSPKALAVPCYADSERDLAGIIDATLRDAGLTIGREARVALTASLGGDRLATRSELAKLALYVKGRREVSFEDIEAVISDVSSLTLDIIVDAAFAGDPAGVEAGLQRLRSEGMNPAGILSAALRHGLALVNARLDVESGRDPVSVAEGWRGLHFKRQPAVKRQLARWTSAGLRAALDSLQGATLASRRSADLGEAIAARVLLELARSKAGR